jgi:hypothetical protein
VTRIGVTGRTVGNSEADQKWASGKLQGRRLYSIPHARALTIFLELNPRPSPGPVAQPLSALAHGNLFRPEDGQDRFCGVLGIHGAGKKTAAPLPEMDRGDGQLCAAEAEKPLAGKKHRRRFPLMSADQEDLAAN